MTNIAYFFRNRAHNHSQNQAFNKTYDIDVFQKSEFIQPCDMLSFARQIALGMVSCVIQ